MSFILITVFVLAQAETPMSFQEVWATINKNSSAQEASRLQMDAVKGAESRANLHWLPRLYLDAKGYQTNDPGLSFFGLLQQRSLQQSDFDPNAINHPNAKFYSRGALGVDWAIYEGGMKSARSDLYKANASAEENRLYQLQLEQYSQTGLSYGSLSVLRQQKEKLQLLSQELERLTKNYQLGNRANPLGYSGLLGMKSLANRLMGLLQQNEAQTKAQYAVLNEMGLKKEQWMPQMTSAVQFIKKNLFPAHHGTSSYKTESLKQAIQMSEQMANMEKAKFRPRVGLFAEGYTFKGTRDVANGYSAGVYLQWSLFDPNEFGVLKEAKLKSMAAAKMAQATEEQERAERTAMVEGMKALESNIQLMETSTQLLLEQSKSAKTLFQNGSINVLQFLEILNRRTDLLVQLTEAELALLKTASQAITKEKYQLDSSVKVGAIQ